MPLVVFSHGSGGDYRNYNWLIKILVSHGYVVAALNHPFNTAMDNTDEGVIKVWDRPNDLSKIIDALLKDSKWSQHINPGQISALGHSSGGYTAIALAGAIYDSSLMRTYCSSENRGPDCDLAKSNVFVDYSESSLSYKDDRIKVVIAMAPAVGPAITEQSLKAINIPVLILAAEDDEVLNISQHAERYASLISQSELKLVSGGGHFIFMECGIPTRIADFFITDLDLCGNQFDVDRDAIRAEIANQVVDFLNLHLSANPRDNLMQQGSSGGTY